MGLDYELIKEIDKRLLVLLGEKCIVKYKNTNLNFDKLMYLGHGKYSDNENYFCSAFLDKVIGHIIYLL